MINIYIPYIKKYKKSAINAIESNWISNYGENIKLANNKIKNFLGVKYCILMNNGTAATHSLFLSVKYKYPHVKKIYIPNNVFIAAYNCALMEYDKEQLEVMEIDRNTLNINTSEEYIRTLDKNSCVLIVHNLGNIVNVIRLKKMRPDLIFIEDNCEGLFGRYEDKYSGSSSDSLCSSVSFYANKSITTGEGGAYFTNDKDLYEYISSVYSHGMTQERYIHERLAYNYRMTNIEAGFLYDQLNDIEHILNLKKNVFNNYDKLFYELIKNKKIIKIKTDKNTKSANWLYCIIIKNIKFNEIEIYMNKKNIEIRPFFYDIRRHKHLKDIKVKYEPLDIFNEGVMLPSYPDIEYHKQKYVYKCIEDYIYKIIN